MGDTNQNNWTRRDFIKGIGGTTAGMGLSSCAISGNTGAKGLTEEALSVELVVKGQDLQKNRILQLVMFLSMIVRHLRSPGKKASSANMV